MTQINLSKVPEQYRSIVAKADNEQKDGIIVGKELIEVAKNIAIDKKQQILFTDTDAEKYLKDILGEQCFLVGDQKKALTFSTLPENVKKVMLDAFMMGSQTATHIDLDDVRDTGEERYYMFYTDPPLVYLLARALSEKDGELYEALRNVETEGLFNDWDVSKKDVVALLSGYKEDGTSIDSNIVNKLDNMLTKLLKTRGFVCSLLKYAPDIYWYLDDKWTNNRDVLLMAVKGDVTFQINENKDVMLSIIEKDYDAFQYASLDLRNDKEFVRKCLSFKSIGDKNKIRMHVGSELWEDSSIISKVDASYNVGKITVYEVPEKKPVVLADHLIYFDVMNAFDLSSHYLFMVDDENNFDKLHVLDDADFLFIEIGDTLFVNRGRFSCVVMENGFLSWGDSNENMMLAKASINDWVELLGKKTKGGSLILQGHLRSRIIEYVINNSDYTKEKLIK